jgi:hypothetical protein
MKSLLIAIVSVWVGACALADIPPEVQTAFAFLSNLHLSAGETNAILSEWNQPTQFQSGTNLISVAIAGENRKWSLSSNEAVLGTVSMNSYGSEFQARLTWALKQTSRSAPPDSYFNSYLAPISTEHFALVCQGAAPVLTNRTEAIAVFALWNNHVFCFEPAGSDSQETLLEDFLRAGGVDIPDEPEPQDPNLDPNL